VSRIEISGAEKARFNGVYDIKANLNHPLYLSFIEFAGSSLDANSIWSHSENPNLIIYRFDSSWFIHDLDEGIEDEISFLHHGQNTINKDKPPFTEWSIDFSDVQSKLVIK
tara:strand:+ start:73 stop:405 length:333 start_codon:yes stop_codon:yes gene_type:complete